MSANLEVVKQLDDNVELDNSSIYLYDQPSNSVAVFYLTADSSSINSQISWELKPDSREVIDPPGVLLYWQSIITTDGYQLSLTDGTFGLRQDPLLKMGYWTATRNSIEQKSQSNGRLKCAFDYYDYNIDVLREYDNLKQLDQSVNYSDLDQSLRNPIRTLIDTVPGDLHIPRGVFNPSISLVQNGNTATVTFQVFLPVEIQWWKKPISLTNNIKLTYNWAGAFSSQLMYSGSACSHITAITNSLPQLPVLVYKKRVPPKDVALPKQLQWSYQYYNIYTTSPQYLTTGTQANFTINSVTLSDVPIGFMFICYRQDGDYYSNTNFGSLTDTFNPILNMTLTYGSENNKLSNYTTRDLYDLAKQNGLDVTYQQYINNGICPLYISYQQLYSATTPYIGGSKGVNLQFAATNVAVKILGATGNYVFSALPLYDGLIRHTLNDTYIDLAPLTQQEVSKASYIPNTVPNAGKKTLIGEGIIDSISQFLKETKLISNLANSISKASILPEIVQKGAKFIGETADERGFGLQNKRGSRLVRMRDMA